jgi:hypothetical protein
LLRLEAESEGISKGVNQSSPLTGLVCHASHTVFGDHGMSVPESLFECARLHPRFLNHAENPGRDFPGCQGIMLGLERRFDRRWSPSQLQSTSYFGEDSISKLGSNSLPW